MILTVCTRAQLAGALALGASIRQQEPNHHFIIGLADEPTAIPDIAPYTLLTLADTVLTASELATLSARYTPTEFTAAVKPRFIQAAFAQYPADDMLLYFSSYSFVYQPLTPVFSQLANQKIVLNPHWLIPPADDLEPDEKHLQNVGLYSSSCMGFRRDPETMRMLTWWESRCLAHAAVDFCVGSCLDQLWLMHVPTLFAGVSILKNPGLQVALWNLPERHLQDITGNWQVQAVGTETPLLTADFQGLLVKREGLFQHQNRLKLSNRPDIRQLVAHYKVALAPYHQTAPPPAYGAQPEPTIRIGWRRAALHRLGQLRQWIATVPVKPVHR
ncbi:hypothetical protein [Fibrella aquatilis]|uniref:Uncharacterized protein n=1 Tax=Fibrella aquatilis TaxID=2817059 RepID=A0A939GDD7_9BACT|nr:hypothetical protein [Fibrella aquatilis]MBO0934785.1 hypothetical protein [Fibrella aquatilis]